MIITLLEYLLPILVNYVKYFFLIINWAHESGVIISLRAYAIISDYTLMKNYFLSLVLFAGLRLSNKYIAEDTV